MRLREAVLAAMTAMVISSAAPAAEWGLKEGTPDLKSAGTLAFGPDGVLFVGDAKGASVFAIDTADTAARSGENAINIDGIEQKVAGLLGAKAVVIRDLAVNPISGNVYLAVAADSKPALVRVEGSGKLSNVSLEKVKFLKAELPDAPEDKTVQTPRGPQNRREESITDLAYSEGKVYVSGVADGGPSPAAVRSIPFPFADTDASSSVEIYHGAHGRLEDNATIRTFLPLNIDGEPSLLAGFVCTPLVKFPITSLKPGAKTRGTTVAELGNRNRPLDMIVYEKDGKNFLLMANSARGVMKISTENIARKEGITEPVRGGGTAGQPYETVKELNGVVQLDKLSNTQAVILVQAEGGPQSLKTIALP